LNKVIRDSGIVDEVVWVGNEEAREIAYLLSQKEGVLCGMSAGANVYVAIQEARKPEAKDKNIVAVLVDRGDRYFSDERDTT
jgi:cysteine synthase A